MTSHESICLSSVTNAFVCSVTTCEILDSSSFVDRFQIRTRQKRDRDVGQDGFRYHACAEC